MQACDVWNTMVKMLLECGLTVAFIEGMSVLGHEKAKGCDPAQINRPCVAWGVMIPYTDALVKPQAEALFVACDILMTNVTKESQQTVCGARRSLRRL